MAYNENFFVGKITSISQESDTQLNINFLSKRKDGFYKWPRQKDMDLVSPKYIFHSTPAVQQVGTGTFVLNNEKVVLKQYNEYKKRYLLN